MDGKDYQRLTDEQKNRLEEIELSKYDEKCTKDCKTLTHLMNDMSFDDVLSCAQAWGKDRGIEITYTFVHNQIVNCPDCKFYQGSLHSCPISVGKGLEPRVINHNHNCPHFKEKNFWQVFCDMFC